MTDELLDRAEGALLGLACGDAVSFPAMYHRQLAHPPFRRLLWTQALELDAEQVNKFPLPMTLSRPVSMLAFGPTDDSEHAALAAVVLLGAGPDPSMDRLFDTWWGLVEPQHESMWGSVADRSAVKNALQGMRAPRTGNDNPHHYDDSSVARAVPVGIRWAGDPETAATVARRLASITNAEVGIDGPAAFAAAVAVLVGGGDLEAAVGAARSQIGSGTWLSRMLATAEGILEEHGSLFAAVPAFNDDVANRTYNFGNVVAETLPLALLIAGRCSGLEQGLAIATLVPKQADTLPAMVGALLGGAFGGTAIPRSWASRVEELTGVCVPSTLGVRLRDLAAALTSTSPRAHEAARSGAEPEG